MIEESFNDTDVLITDASSVIAMFFMTGKPIIFCPKEPYDEKELSGLLQTIIPGLYIAHNWLDVNKYLDKLLLRKEDLLLDKRLDIIRKNFKYNDNATDNIVEYVYADFSKTMMGAINND